MSDGESAPDGYVRMRLHGLEAVALATCREAIRRALADGTLHEYAARHPARRVLEGRVAAYAVPLPHDAARVVVRRSHHGGLLAPLTGDRFLPPTRAPRELETTLRLRRSGVPTPELVAYVIYTAGPLLRRADVATREIVGGRDLGATLVDRDAAVTREVTLAAVAELLRALGKCGAVHPDLNVKNVLLAPDGGGTRAFVLDVDRVRFAAPEDPRVTAANVRRLSASARKWRADRGARIDDADLAWLAETARGAA